MEKSKQMIPGALCLLKDLKGHLSTFLLPVLATPVVVSSFELLLTAQSSVEKQT